MPQLPSGRHIAIGLDPLNRLIDGIKDNPYVTDLLAIETREHLYRYVELLYLAEDPTAATPDYAQRSVPVSADLKPSPSGYTLADLGNEVESWSTADQHALADFLQSDRVLAYLDDTLASVQAAKRRLINDPRFSVRSQAAFWLGGAHPLQTDE